MTGVCSLSVSLIGLAAHLTSLVAYYTMNAPARLKKPVETRFLGPFLFLTYQTNMLNTGYFALAAAAAAAPSATLDSLVTQLFPLAFALGCMLSLLYYLLDHRNPDKVALDTEWAQRGYPYMWLGNHLEHALALPVAMLFAVDIRDTPHSAAQAARPVLTYVACYMLMSVTNWKLTGLWAYPIVTKVQDAGGVPAVGLFFMFLAVVSLSVGLAGVWIANVTM